MTVARIWADHDLAPHRIQIFKFSTDPELLAKVTDLCALYLEPPAGAVVLWVDEKSQIQALDRTAPALPLRPGLAERRTHDYVRHGITSLFAALEVATGKVTGRCFDRHRHTEFLIFLKLVAAAIHAETSMWCSTTTAPTSIPPSGTGSPNTRGSDCISPDLGELDEPGRDLLRAAHPPGHPPRQPPQRPRPDHRDPPLHRRLERPLPAIFLG
jgi:hypothetical protein